ncbi:MAG TPA: 2-hydroxyacid dehydrogenase [Microbacteriaceae bacterium]|nr:2-hydroxyacid dehydrogenase [Microbacteriaceae bacterium]
MSKKIVVSVAEESLFNELKNLPEIDVLMWDMTGPAPVPEIDIVVPPYMDGEAPLAQLAGVQVKLVQWQSIGYDGVEEHLPNGIPFANARTVHETSTAELAVGLAIAAQRGIPEAVEAKTRRAWEPVFRPSLADRKILLLGYGGVSKAIEARLQPFETEITRVASVARAERNSEGKTVHVHGISEVANLIGDAEIVIVGLPLNETTAGLIDATMLARLQNDALLINVGRGAVVDTAALVKELESGRIRAALDVVDPEPLPSDHPLWGCENLLLMPHVGGDTSAMLPRIVALIKKQVQNLIDGEPFENLVSL